MVCRLAVAICLIATAKPSVVTLTLTTYIVVIEVTVVVICTTRIDEQISQYGDEHHEEYS